jgi:hypothetical protein
MASIYDQTIANAANIVLRASDRELSSDGFSETVFKSAKINIPKLNLPQTKVQIKTEEISYRNAPPGISFSISGSRTIEYALYSIPVSGDMELFAYLVRPYIDRRRTYMEYNTLYYKEYSDIKISGNDELVNAIKERVVAFTTNVNNSLSQFENEVNQFHENKLKPTIAEFIKSEIVKRNLKSDSESKLNPFA